MTTKKLLKNIEGFIRYREDQILKLQCKKRPTEENKQEFMYLSGWCDAMKAVRLAIKEG